jgi:hypothetical protein
MRIARLTLPLLLCLAACADPAATPAAPEPDTPGDASSAPAPEDTPAPEPAAPTEPATPAPASNTADATAVPARFQGRYASDAAACGRPGDESHLQIQDRQIVFQESSGAVSGAQVDGDQIAITAQMTGEGETWERTSRFRLDGEDVLVDSEHGMRRVRCTGG